MEEEWVITAEKHKEYAQKFSTLPGEDCETGGRKVPGNEVKTVLDASGLDPKFLMQIWDLSDRDQDGYLSDGEFNIAMYLIDRINERGKELPNEDIPQKLVDSAMSAMPERLKAQGDQKEKEGARKSDEEKLDPHFNIYGTKALQYWTEEELKKWIADQTKEKKEVLEKAFKGLTGKDFGTLKKEDIIESLVEAGSSASVADAVYGGLLDLNDTAVELTSTVHFSINNKDAKNIEGIVISQDLREEFPYEVKVQEKLHRMKLKVGTMRLIDTYQNNVKFKLEEPSKVWIIPFSKKQNYEHEFNKLNKQEKVEGLPLRVVGNDARVCLDASGLNVNYLQMIWQLSDIDEDGCLTLPELMVALFLIDSLKEGTIKELPRNVPQNLIDSARIPIRPDDIPPLEEWSKDEVTAWCEERPKFKNEMMEGFKDMVGADVAVMNIETMTERLKKNMSSLSAKLVYYDFQSLKKYAVLPYGENYFAGTKAAAVQKLIENKAVPGYLKSLENLDKLQEIINQQNEISAQTGNTQNGDDIDNNTWEKMTVLFLESMENQQQSFEFNPVVHRFPDTYPFDYNAMPMYIGSWMGDCFGMMQWPMPGEDYMEVLKTIVVDNDVGMIQALGIQNPNERMEMINYWETIGIRTKPTQNIGNCVVHEVEVKGKALIIIHFPEWPDYGKPLEDTADFEYMFSQVRKVEDAGERILVHCRAGVGRSGTFRLMYKAWCKKLDKKDRLKAMNEQRALRSWTVQTKAQYNFLGKYLTTVPVENSEGEIGVDQKPSATSTTISTTTTTTTETGPP